MSRRPCMAHKRNAMATLGVTKKIGSKPAPKAGARVEIAEKSASKASGANPQISPLTPKIFANLPPLAGVRLATGQAGIKYRDRPDVLFMVLAPGTQVAGVLTKSKTSSAPVDWCRKLLPTGTARVLVVNSGNANAFTRRAGADSVREVAESAAGGAGCRATEGFLASTGGLAEPLPYQKITRILGPLA